MNHSEARVVKHMADAWSDVPEWCKSLILDSPCDACLTGNAPRIGPSGQTPQDEGLAYIDLWHTQVPGIFSGNKTRLVLKHAKTGFVAAVAIDKKSDAPEAYLLKLAYFNSIGRPLTWNHADNAPELIAGKMIKIAREHLIRFTTTVPGVGRTNAVEPINRVAGKVVRRLLAARRTYHAASTNMPTTTSSKGTTCARHASRHTTARSAACSTRNQKASTDAHSACSRT